MRVVQLEIPHLGNRTHLVHDDRVAVVIDPPGDLSVVESAACSAGVEIVAVAETHLHHDYVSSGLELSRRHHAAYLVAADEGVDFDHVGVHHHETLSFGDLDLRVIATPGHTPHHVSFLATDQIDDPGVLFSGGSLLHGGVGRTDLTDPALTPALTRAQWRTARRLTKLDAETVLHPTHGVGSLCSWVPTAPSDDRATIGDQLRENPVLTRSRDAFSGSLSRGLDPVPAHYPHLVARNRRGPWSARPARRAGTSELRSALARGAQVIDIRSRAAYADGHPAGSISVAHGPLFAAYAGWVTPWGSETVIVSDSEEDLESAEKQLASIGIEGISTVLLGRASKVPWAGHRRVDWAALADSQPAGIRVLLDVRRPEEWRAGHLLEALNIPVEELAHRLDEVPDGQVWVHCQAGFRAGVAAGLLDRAGREVVLIDDAFSAVHRLGLPVRRTHEAA